MAVFRIEKNKNYTVMSNYHLKDKKLSFKAKGLLSYMLSLPDDWDYSLEGLCKVGKDNITSVRSTLKELKENNYVIIKKIMPNESKSGRIEYEYTIFENPISKKQDIGFLYLENLSIENHRQLNTNKLNTKKDSKKEKQKRNKKSKTLTYNYENKMPENLDDIYDN